MILDDSESEFSASVTKGIVILEFREIGPQRFRNTSSFMRLQILFIHSSIFFSQGFGSSEFFHFFFLSPSRPDAPLANPAAFFFPNGKWISATADWLSSVFCFFFFFMQPFDTSIVSCFDRPRPPAGNGRNSLIRPQTSRKKKQKTRAR